MLSQGPKGAHRGAACGPRIRKGGEESVAFSAVDKPALSLDRTSDQSMMIGQNRPPGPPDERRQPRRTLDVSEKQGDGALRWPTNLTHKESLTSRMSSIPG